MLPIKIKIQLMFSQNIWQKMRSQGREVDRILLDRIFFQVQFPISDKIYYLS